MATNPERNPPPRPYSGYRQPHTGEPDTLLTAIGPGTACGDYLRRFWQPVAMASELGELPRLIRILGEDLVLFRTRAGEAGLVQVVLGQQIRILQPQTFLQAPAVGIGFHTDGRGALFIYQVPKREAIAERYVQFPSLFANVGDAERHHRDTP